MEAKYCFGKTKIGTVKFSQMIAADLLDKKFRGSLMSPI
jgi:hypothetical protein